MSDDEILDKKLLRDFLEGMKGSPLSPDEEDDLDDWMEGIGDMLSIYDPDNLQSLPIGSGPVIKRTKPDCDHDWVDYHGLSRSYKYCKKCDKKKE